MTFSQHLRVSRPGPRLLALMMLCSVVAGATSPEESPTAYQEYSPKDRQVPCALKCAVFLAHLCKPDSVNIDEVISRFNVSKDDTASLLDLKSALTDLGIRVVPTRVESMTDLSELKTLAVVTLVNNAQNHFVVLLHHEENDKVLLCDPPDLFRLRREGLLDRMHPVVLTLPDYRVVRGDNALEQRQSPVSRGNADLLCENAEVFLGRVSLPLREPLKVDFPVKNVSNHEVHIENLVTSCGCSPAVTQESVLPPGSQTKVTMTIDDKANLGGMSKKYTCVVRSSRVIDGEEQPKENLLLVAGARYAQRVNLTSYSLDFSTIESWKSRESPGDTIRLIDSWRDGNAIVSAETSEPWIGCKTDTESIHIFLRPPQMSFGWNRGHVLLKTKEGDVTIPVQARFIGEYSVLPKPVVIDLERSNSAIAYIARNIEPQDGEAFPAFDFPNLPEQCDVEYVGISDGFALYKFAWLEKDLEDKMQFVCSLNDTKGTTYDWTTVIVFPPSKGAAGTTEDKESGADLERGAIEISDATCTRISSDKAKVVVRITNGTTLPACIGIEVDCRSDAPSGETLAAKSYSVSANDDVLLTLDFMLPSAQGANTASLLVAQMKSRELYRQGGLAFVPPEAPVLLRKEFVLEQP